MTTTLQRLTMLGLLAVLGCGPRGADGGMSIPDGGGGAPDGPAPVGAQESGSAGELKAKIVRLRADQNTRASVAASDKAACHDVCGLTAQICEATEKLCKIADRRPQENEYQVLCREAELECREATEHCERCVEGHVDDDANSTQPPPPAD